MKTLRLFVLAVLPLAACKKAEPPQQAQSPAAPPTAQAPAGARAEERVPYVDIYNDTGSAVTVRLNGELVGTWDGASERIDLRKAKKGENAIEFDVAAPAKGAPAALRVYVKYTVPKDAYSTKTDELLTLSLGGKPGKHSAAFNWN